MRSPRRKRVPVVQTIAQRIQLFETHASPYLYACYATHSRPGSDTTTTVVAPIATQFHTAFGLFKKFFESKTKKQWNERAFERVETNDTDDTKVFEYYAPKDGNWGVIPAYPVNGILKKH